MLSITFAVTFLLTITTNCLAYKLINEEFLIPKCGNQLVLRSRFLVEQNNTDKEFWICVDYETTVGPNLTQWNPYPASECGGKSQAHKNLYWYAFHGKWDHVEKDKLALFFLSSAEYPWLLYERVIPPRKWESNVLRLYWFKPEESVHFEIIQAHGSHYDGKIKNSEFDSVNNKLSEITVRTVADHSNIHIRVNGVGLQIQEIYEHQTVDAPIAMQEDSAVTQNSNSTAEICSTIPQT